MDNRKHIIWTSDIDYEDWRDDMEAEYPDEEGYNEQWRIDRAYEINDDYLDDERSNLDIQLSQPIIVLGDLGRWNGRVKGYKEIKSGNISDCLYSNEDYVTWYVDEKGDFRCDASHHDGTNHYLYRVFKDDITDEDIDEFEEKVYEGTATQEDIEKYTRRLGDDIGVIYGWSFPKR